MKKQNQNGFSLIEMMVVVAILSIVALGLSSYMLNLSKQQKHAQDNIEIMQLKTLVQATSIDAQSIHTSGSVYKEVQVPISPSGRY